MGYELIDHKEVTQRLRDEGAPDWLIWVSEQSQEIEDEFVLRDEKEFLESLIVTDFPEGTVYRYKD